VPRKLASILAADAVGYPRELRVRARGAAFYERGHTDKRSETHSR